MTSYLLQRSTWWQPRSDDEDDDDSDGHWPHLTQYHWEMTADVASLTACVVVDCCSKTRDSNTPHIRPRRVDPAWPAQRVSQSAHLECFHPFKGAQPQLWPLALALSYTGGIWGPLSGCQRLRRTQGPHTSLKPFIHCVTLAQARGQQSTDRGVELSERNNCEPELR